MNYLSEYNRNKLKEKLREVECTALGLTTPIGRFVCGEAGLPTEEKIQELADRVIYYQSWFNSEYIGISGVYRRYYELLFYLILRAYDPKGEVYDFVDFLKAAKELDKGFSCREELLVRENDISLKMTHKTFERIQESCRLLTGKTLTSGMTDEEIAFIKDVYRQKHVEYEKKQSELERIYDKDENVYADILAKYADYGLEGDTDYYTAMEEYIYDEAIRQEIIYQNERETLKLQGESIYDKRKKRYLSNYEVEQWIENEPKQREKWKNSFKNPEEYFKAYEEFSYLIFCVDVFGGEHNLEETLLQVLEDEELNRIDNDDKIVRMIAELNRAIRIAKSKI